MCLSDTAEYWQDVNRPRMPYVGKQYYHIPNAECGRKHWNEAKAIEDVNCTDCLKLISEGYVHNLPEGKTDFRSKGEIKRQAKAEKERLYQERLGLCSCGYHRIKRFNEKGNVFFLGCANYPKCKITSPIVKTE